MGIVAGVCTSMACCFTQASCQLCCAACPSCKSSTAARVGYCVLLGFAALSSYICTADFFKYVLVRLWQLCNNTEDKCGDFIGFEAVYRVQFSLALFFFFMAILMLGVRTGYDIRAIFQRGLWFFKVAIVVGIVIGVSYIPRSPTFNTALMIMGYIASFIFIIIQVLLLIDFAYSWNESWVDRGETDVSWLWAMMAVIVITVGIGLAGVVCSYMFLARSDVEECALRKFWVSLHLIISVSLFGLATFARYKGIQATSGLFEASLVFLYTTYLVFSAFTFQTSPCNQLIVEGSQHPALRSVFNLISLIFTILILSYASFSNAEKVRFLRVQAHLLGFGPSRAETPDSGTAQVGGSEQGQHVYDDEESGVVYNYSLFHFEMLLASLYIMMTITNWYNPNKPNGFFSDSSAMWIKLSTSLICQILYGWTIFAPLILNNRDFSI